MDFTGWLEPLGTAIGLDGVILLAHYPCSTTMFTIYKETKSARWTAVSGLMPLGIAFIVLFLLNQGARLLGLL